MSGDIFGFHKWGGGGVLLASSGWRPVILLNNYNVQGSPHHRELSSPKCQECEIEERALDIMYFSRVFIVSLHLRLWPGCSDHLGKNCLVMS